MTNTKKIKGLFEDRADTLPVWFMRQAGRYHSHYQNIKKNSDFMTMCKNPKLARDITLGPIEDFHFNAAILFSDLLFPLEHLGMGLSYGSGPPKLAWHLNTLEDLKKFHKKQTAKEFFSFQGKACELLRDSLPPSVDLIGFVGGPFTLYTYATEGSHGGNLVSAKLGLFDGRFDGFCESLMPELLEEMLIQATGGVDALALFDTAAGELSPLDFKEKVIPQLTFLFREFKSKYPKVKLIYYSKQTHWGHLEKLPYEFIDVIGVDWRWDLVELQNHLPKHLYIQGNIDPVWAHLPKDLLLFKAKNYYLDLRARGLDFHRFIAGLGHGVLIKTPEENIRSLVKLIQSMPLS